MDLDDGQHPGNWPTATTLHRLSAGNQLKRRSRSLVIEYCMDSPRTAVTEDGDILIVLVSKVSELSAPFQSMVHNYALDVLNEPETHSPFIASLQDNPPIPPMREETGSLKASVPAAGIL